MLKIVRYLPVYLLAFAFVISACVITVSAAEDPDNGVVVFDQKHAWGSHTTIDLFERNELDDQLVYPGVKGKYSFTVRNSSSRQRECDVIIEDDNPFVIPLSVRIKRDGEYISGSENEWIESANFDSGVYMLAPYSETKYELEWKWDYYLSDEQDTEDTSLGMHAREENEPYNITINVYAEAPVTESDPPPENSQPDTPESIPDAPGPSETESNPSTGESDNICLFLLCGISLLTAGFLWRRKGHG